VAGFETIRSARRVDRDGASFGVASTDDPSVTVVVDREVDCSRVFRTSVGVLGLPDLPAGSSEFRPEKPFQAAVLVHTYDCHATSKETVASVSSPERLSARYFTFTEVGEGLYVVPTNRRMSPIENRAETVKQ
jgi:hypothetical protein